MKLFSVMTRGMAVGLGALLALSAAAQDYPSKPIRILNPQAAGGASSALAHVIGEKLTESWGQPVIVDNRPGGNTVIATDALLTSPPDGYTAMYVTTAHATLPSLMSNLPYDTIRDLVPVATVATGVYVLVVHPSVEAKTVEELIALAKSKPGELNYASSGNGQGSHLAGAMFNILAGTDMQHIPYKGTSEVMADLLGGQVQLLFTTAFNASAYIETGQLRALAVGSKSRLPILPDVPTFAEAGLPAMDVDVWHGIVMRAGTPKEIVDKWATEIARILTLPDVGEALGNFGFAPFISTPEQFSDLMKSDISKYETLIKAANIKVE